MISLVLQNILYFYLSISDWDYFYAGKFPWNESFRTDIVPPFATCWMFNFSVTVLLKAEDETSYPVLDLFR